MLYGSIEKNGTSRVGEAGLIPMEKMMPHKVSGTLVKDWLKGKSPGLADWQINPDSVPRQEAG